MALRAEHVHPAPRPEVERTGFRLSWGAVVAGLVIALVVQVILSLIGLAIGFGAVNFLTGNLQDVGVGAGIWAVVTALISLFVGGMAAGHLAGRLTRFDGMLHGVLVWGLSMIVALWALSAGVGMLLGGMFGVAGQTLAAAVGGATRLTAAAAEQTGITPQTLPTSEQEMIAILERQGMSRQQAQQVVNEIQQTAQQARARAQEVQQRAPAVATEVAGAVSTAIWWVLAAAILSLLAAAGGAALTAKG
jgi:hypothetical protein